ncbi:putative endo-beta-1,6-glucanase [Ilyonectria sp. MPI-CAGE-AT-0026]|nr:putative endo-beta-1,6-glucanase [Ilyonectria sp. MPI-CAGE-AT-0026]
MKLIALVFLCATVTHAWLPADRGLFKGKGKLSKLSHPGAEKIRGVNLGSLFVVEPWMIQKEWTAMGCAGTNSEFDCVKALGQVEANTAFQNHWNNWFTKRDMDAMVSFGLNTLRIPLGFWMDESLVYSDEYFPQGALPALEKVCNWAAERGFYVILEMHGAPGAQTAWQAFTGKWVEKPGFYNATEYARAYKFLQWLTRLVHTNRNFRTVGMLGVINEPNWDEPSVLSDFYPTAYSKIRSVESSLRVKAKSALHIQYMDTKWGAGNPNQNLTNTFYTAYDNHRYLKSDLTVPVSQKGYLSASCNDKLPVPGETPLIVGEWSLGPKTSEEHSPQFQVANDTNKDFYTNWWAAQVMAYEKGLGWTFWSWKTELDNDYRWSYLEAVRAGVIKTDPGKAYKLRAC